MKKITLSLFTLLLASTMLGQSYSTGTIALISSGGTNLNYSAKIDVTSTLVTLTLTGPSSGWLGIGFDAASMDDVGKDAVIFDGTNLTDRTYNGIGVVPPLDAIQNWTVTSNTVAGSVRTVVGTRALNTGDANDHVFTASASPLTIVFARKVANFTISYHGGSSCGSTVANFTLGTTNFEQESFKMYPNPVKGQVTIELPATVASGEAKVYDTLGRVVIIKTITTNDNKIDTSGLLQGNYMVVVRTDYGNATKTLIVE